jgi:hypothetical protein
MGRFAAFLATMLLLAGTGLYAGCGNSASGLTTSSTAAAGGDVPGGVSNEDPLARPVSVAWTSARAQRCGFYFDPAKLRSNYLAYEAKQGAAGEQLAKIERSYDTTFKVIGDRVAANPDYCSDKKSAEIKAHLGRHLAGDFTPNLPKAKAVAACGGLFNPCETRGSDEPFDQKKFWDKQDRDNMKR